MADGLCDWGGEPHTRNHILTTISPPITVELCDDHYGPGLIPLLAAEIGVDPGKFYESVERFLARAAKAAERELADAQAAEQAEGSGSSGPDDGSDGQVLDENPETGDMVLYDDAGQVVEAP